MPAQWTLQEAQTRFPELITAARRGEPQYISDGSSDDIVVIAKKQPHYYSQQTSSSRSFKDALRAMPKGEPLFDEDRSGILNPRDVDL